jgi:hypothetical protein
MDVERSNTGQIVKYILLNYVSLIMLIFKVYTGPWFPLHLYNYRTVLVHVHRTRGGLDHYTICKLIIDV